MFQLFHQALLFVQFQNLNHKIPIDKQQLHGELELEVFHQDSFGIF